MDWTLEVVIVPVSDLDRAVGFYRDAMGFALDHDTQMPGMRIAQLTPRGSGCSIVLTTLPVAQEMAPGSLRGLQLCVADARAARDELVARGVDAGEIQEIDPRDGGTLFDLRDPDGNVWVVQQLRSRADWPLIPHEYRERFAEGTRIG